MWCYCFVATRKINKESVLKNRNVRTDFFKKSARIYFFWTSRWTNRLILYNFSSYSHINRRVSVLVNDFFCFYSIVCVKMKKRMLEIRRLNSSCPRERFLSFIFSFLRICFVVFSVFAPFSCFSFHFVCVFILTSNSFWWEDYSCILLLLLLWWCCTFFSFYVCVWVASLSTCWEGDLILCNRVFHIFFPYLPVVKGLVNGWQVFHLNLF